MPSIQILYEADHQNRALALMNSLANDANADPVDVTPTKVAGLKTLIFWGHGNQVALCGKSGKDIASIVKAWKGKNPKLNTIEIITCNSRHFDDKAVAKKHLKSMITHLAPSSRINNSIAKQIKRELKYSIYPSINSIKVLSMPESLRGGFKQYSILYWDQVTTSWCYVTGNTEQEMFTIGANIKHVKKVPFDKDSPWDDPRTGNFPTKLAAAKIDFPAADYQDCEAGPLTTLRNILVKVK